MEDSSESPHEQRLHQQNHSSSSLHSRETDLAIPNRNALLRPASHQYIEELPTRLPSNHHGRLIPQISLNIPLNQYWNQSSMSWETPIHSEMTASRLEAKLPAPLTRTRHTSRRYSREGARTSISSQKNLQLSGYSPRHESAIKEMHQQNDHPRTGSPAPSNYSGSVYNLQAQPEIFLGTNQADLSDQRESYLSIVDGEQSRWSSGDSSPNPESAGRSVLRPFYKLSEHMSDAISSVTSLRHRDSSARVCSEQIKQDEIATLRDLLADERARQNKRLSWSFERVLDAPYRQKLTEEDILNLTPRPLALRPKRISTKLGLEIKPDPEQNNDPLEHDIDEMIHSMTGRKLYNTPTTAFLNDKDVPLPLNSTRKLFGSGKHPLKSPFPFHHAPDIPDTVPETDSVERTFSKRLSGAMKHLHISPISPRIGVISNSARRPNGPDTPNPNSKSPFKGFFPSLETTIEKGGMHLQEAVTKAKKSVRFKTSGERNRQSLKKSIVYVGISDQSPGTASMNEP